MDDLENIRLRHGFLLCVYQTTLNYVTCLERGYLGDKSEKEVEFCKQLHASMDEMFAIIGEYRKKQEELLT